MMREAIYFRCQLCGRSYQSGPGRYEGKTIPRFQLSVCGSCYDTNHDGWGPVVESAFERHLMDRGIPFPERNARGWYPRD